MEKEKEKPVQKFRVGSVAASIWKRSNKAPDEKQFVTYQVSLDRTWLDKEGNYHSSNSFGLNEVPKAILAMEQAYEFIATKASSEGNGVSKE